MAGVAASGLLGTAGQRAPLRGRHSSVMAGSNPFDRLSRCCAAPSAGIDGPRGWLHPEGAFVCTHAAASSNMRLYSI